MSEQKKVIMNYEVVEVLHTSPVWGNLVFTIFFDTFVEKPVPFLKGL